MKLRRNSSAQHGTQQCISKYKKALCSHGARRCTIGHRAQFAMAALTKLVSPTATLTPFHLPYSKQPQREKNPGNHARFPCHGRLRNGTPPPPKPPNNKRRTYTPQARACPLQPYPPPVSQLLVPPWSMRLQVCVHGEGCYDVTGLHKFRTSSVWLNHTLPVTSSGVWNQRHGGV